MSQEREPEGLSLPAPVSALGFEGTPRSPEALRDDALRWRDEGQRYRRLTLLGEGGMGSVWLGVDTLLDRSVAMKVPSAEGGNAALLQREARLAARLDHPGIVAVFDIATVEGWPCYVMAHVRGHTLSERIRSGAAASWPIAERVRIIREAAAALDYAHREGIVHNDLSPANLLCSEGGATRIIDWGLAVDLREPGQCPGGGTPGYRAPECEAAGARCSPRSDVWSLGRILSKLLAIPVRTAPPDASQDSPAPAALLGNLGEGTTDAHAGERSALPSIATVESLPASELPASELPASELPCADTPAPIRSLPDPPPLAEDVDPELRAIVARATEADPELRFRDAGELLHALLAWEQAAGRDEAPPRNRRGQRLLRLVTATLMSALLAWAALAILSSSDREAEHEALRSRSISLERNALQNRAMAALEQLDEPGAARSLIGALHLGPTPELRGAALDLLSRPTIPSTTALLPPECEAAAHGPRPGVVACHSASSLSLWAEGTLQWQWAGDTRDIRFLEDSLLVLDQFRHLWLLDLETGAVRGHDPHPTGFAGVADSLRIDMNRQTLLADIPAPDPLGMARAGFSDEAPRPASEREHAIASPCTTSILSAARIATQTLIACTEGGAYLRDAEGQTHALPGAAGHTLKAVALVPGVHAPSPIGGTRSGLVLSLDQPGRSFSFGEAIESITSLAHTDLAVVRGVRGRLAILDANDLDIRWTAGQVPGRLDIHDGTDIYVSDAHHTRHWKVPAALPRYRLRSPHGNSSILWSRDEEELVGLNGAGEVFRFAVDGTRPPERVRWGSGVGMSLSRAPGAETIWMIGAGGGGPREVRPGAVLEVAEPVPVDGDYRQILALDDQHLILISYRWGYLSLDLRSGERAHTGRLGGVPGLHDPLTDIYHVTRDPDARSIAWIADTGVWFESDAGLKRLRTESTWRAGALQRGDRLLVASGGEMLLLNPRDGSEVRSWSEHDPIRVLAAHPTERWFLAGTHGGDLLILESDSGEPLARVSLHAERIASIAAATTAPRIATASWDGSVRILNAHALTQQDPAAEANLIADHLREHFALGANDELQQAMLPTSPDLKDRAP